MNEFANPAKRLSRLIEDVVQKQDSTSTAAVWAEALGLDPTLAQSDPHSVYEDRMGRFLATIKNYQSTNVRSVNEKADKEEEY